jgi:hypothetical protein
MQKHLNVFISAIPLILSLITAAIAADDPFVGTWKLNLTKSKFNPPETAPKGQTYQMKIDGNILNLVTETEPSVGSPRRSEEAVILDGQDRPSVLQKRLAQTRDPRPPFNPSFIADTMASTRVDSHTISYVFRKAGKEIEHAWSVVSKDGKILTSTRKRINEQGEEITTIAVYDKQ